MRRSAPVLLGSALLLLSSPSWPEDNSSWPQEASSYFMLEEVLLRRSDDPTLGSALALPQPKLILETTEDGNTRVKARVGVEVRKKFILNLEVASPKDRSGQTTLADLDGLSNESTAEVGLSWILWNPQADAYKDMLPVDPEDAGTESPMRAYGDPEIGVMSRPSAVSAFGPEGYRAALRKSQDILKSQRSPIFLTVRAKTGQEEFRFVDASTLASGKESHNGQQLTGSVGAYLHSGFYSSLSYRRGTAFAAGRTANLCSPFGSTGALECRDLVVGPPTKKTSEALEFEIRRLFGSLGLAARLSRDLKNDITEVELPIYFLQKMGTSEMELNGGIAIKWRSDTEDYSISAFIGPALSTVARLGK